MFALVSLVVLSILASGFGPGPRFALQLSALLAGVVLGFVYIGRVISGVMGHLTLPRCRPRAVPIAFHRWIAPPVTVVLAVLLVESDVTRKVAFVLDRSALGSIAQGAPVQPSAWIPIRAWSGGVAKGAVWNDVDVWAFEPESPLGKLMDPLAPGPLADSAWKSTLRRRDGETTVDGTVDLRLARLAVFPIAGTGYARTLSAAWAYAPNAPDVFGLKGSVFLRYSGDWYASRSWIEPLEDQP